MYYMYMLVESFFLQYRRSKTVSTGTEIDIIKSVNLVLFLFEILTHMYNKTADIYTNKSI